MARYTHKTVADIAIANSNGLSPQLADGKTTEDTCPGPVGCAPALPSMHSKAQTSIRAQRDRLHRFGNK